MSASSDWWKSGSGYKIFNAGTLYTLLGILFAVIVYRRFAEWAPTVFYGDDLLNYFAARGYQSANPNIAYLLQFISTNKFRPVFEFLLKREIALFGMNITGYFITNILIAAFGGLLAFRIFVVEADDQILAGLFAIIVLTSPFAAFQTTQIIGPVESVAFVLFLLTILFASRAIREPRGSSKSATNPQWWLALFTACVAVYAHERYLILVLWLLVAFWATQTSAPNFQRIIYVTACIAILATNFLIKHFVLHTIFFEGTGGVELGLSLPSIIDLASQAVWSIFGINSGPTHLVGAPWQSLPLPAKVSGAAFGLGCLALGLIALIKTPRISGHMVSWPVLLVLLAVLLLGPPCLTIRMEQRWELAPFMILLMLVAIGLGKPTRDANGPQIATCLAGAIALCSAVTDFAIFKNFDNVYFVSTERYVAAVKASIIDSNPPPLGRGIVLIASQGLCDWALLYGEFFAVYEGVPRPVRCVDSASQLSLASIAQARVYASASIDKLVDITDNVKHDLELRPPKTP